LLIIHTILSPIYYIYYIIFYQLYTNPINITLYLVSIYLAPKDYSSYPHLIFPTNHLLNFLHSNLTYHKPSQQHTNHPYNYHCNHYDHMNHQHHPSS